jgi:hypothetical protein
MRSAARCAVDGGDLVKKSMWFAALALVAGLGLSACGGAGAGAGAPSSTTSSRSAAPGQAVGTTIDGGALATRMTDAMAKAGSGTLSMELGSDGKSSGSFAIRGGAIDQQLSMQVQGQAMEIVSTGGVIYLKGLPGSAKPWAKIDLKADDPVSKMFAGLSGDMSDPRQLAKALEGTKATVVSSAADSSVYDVTIDPSKILGEAGSMAVPSTAPVKARYTLDAQGRPTTMVAQVQGQTVTISYGSWGKPVTIKAPPADQVGPFAYPG